MHMVTVPNKLVGLERDYTLYFAYMYSKIIKLMEAYQATVNVMHLHLVI
jgi:hypothetical protein